MKEQTTSSVGLDTNSHADTELLDWAISHPEDAMGELHSWWAHCGRGGRELMFDFRQCLQSARKRSQTDAQQPSPQERK